LLTSAAIYPLSTRAGGLSREGRDIRPIAVGHELDQVFLPVDGAARWPEPAAYPGVAAGVLFLAGGALLLLRRATFPEAVSRVVFASLLGGGFIGLVFAFGEAGPYGLLADLPVLRSFRVPARFLVSWSLAVALGSGLALSHFLRRVRNARAVGLAALTLLSTDLIWHARRAAPTAPAEVYTIEPAIVRLLRERLSIDEAGFRHRYWTPARPVQIVRSSDAEKAWAARWLEPLSFGLGMRFGLEALGGNQGPALRASGVLSETPSWQAAALAGVGSVVRWRRREPGSGLPPQMYLQNFSPFARARIVPEAVRVPASRTMAAVLNPLLDLRRTAVVEGAEPLTLRPEWDGRVGSVRLRSREPGRVELSATLPAEGVLVLAHSYEKGWKATLDGRSVPVFRANAAFLGVRLPAGEHVVRFEYRPRGLLAGLALATAGALGFLLAAFRLPTDDSSREAPA
jgi:hypothetical protein